MSQVQTMCVMSHGEQVSFKVKVENCQHVAIELIINY